MHHQQKENYKILKSFISGGIAGSLNKTIIAPVERVKYLFVVRTQVIMSQKNISFLFKFRKFKFQTSSIGNELNQTSNRVFSYRLFVEDFTFIVKQHGVTNLWRGNSMNIFRMFPHASIDFATFDFLRGKYYRKQQKTLKMKTILFLCGAFSGITALTCTDALEFVRIRLAMQKSDFTYSNSLHAFKVIYKKQGFLGFYKGYGAACLGVFIYQGIAFSLYTDLKQLVNQKNPKMYTKWYIDFLFGGISSLGQIVAYPLDILRKRMQGQALLVQKGLLESKQNYKQLVTQIYKKQNGLKGFFKGVTLNLIKAPLASASAWTMKNFINRKLNSFYDL